MRFHPAFLAAGLMVLGLSALSYAATLCIRPTIQLIEEATPQARSALVPVIAETGSTVTAERLTIPDVLIKASRTPRQRKVELVERCREVALEQGAEAGQTVIYCERRPKSELP